jgi:hypothetical protein
MMLLSPVSRETVLFNRIEASLRRSSKRFQGLWSAIMVSSSRLNMREVADSLGKTTKNLVATLLMKTSKELPTMKRKEYLPRGQFSR